MPTTQARRAPTQSSAQAAKGPKGAKSAKRAKSAKDDRRGSARPAAAKAVVRAGGVLAAKQPAKQKPKPAGAKRAEPRNGKKHKQGKKKKRAPRFTAASDKYELYQLAVQSPEADVDFLRDTFKQLRKRRARHLREDFCGTALLSSEWVQDSKKNTAEAFDIDPECVEWGREHNLGPLGKRAKRCTLHVADVREEGDATPDLRVAFNFSFNILTRRADLLAYFRRAHASLADDGIFAIDIHGGPESTEAMEEEKDIPEGFTYVWEQGEYHPVTGEQTCHIHFEFKDGSKLRKAFSYHWRLWSMPELRDLLLEAGFASVRCYFEGEEEDSDEGNGIFEYSAEGENCPSWIAYILALK